jgi:hypothetical protein
MGDIPARILAFRLICRIQRGISSPTKVSTMTRPLVGSQQNDYSCHSFYGNSFILYQK